jgi:hypothetical protein
MHSGSRVIVTAVMVALVVLSMPPAAHAQQTTEYIALVDVSESMFDRHEETVTRVLEEIVSEQLDSGDTFHLLSFGEAPEFEMSSRIEGQESINEIISRLLLLKPLEVHTDFTAAMKYLVEYVDGLSLSSKKRILIITDGNNDPPPDSPYHDADENRQRVSDLSQYMKRNGWDVKVLHFGDEDTADGELPPLIRSIGESFDTRVVVAGTESTTSGDVVRPHLEVGFPEKLFQGKERVTVPFTFTNPGEEGRTLRIGEVRYGERNILTEPQSVTLTPGENRSMSLNLRLPDEIGTEESSMEVRLVAEQGGPLTPAEGRLHVRRAEGLFAFGTDIPFLWIILGIVALAIIVFLVRRLVTAAARSTGTEERTPVGTAAGTAAAGELAGTAAERGGDRETESALKSAARRRGASSETADLLSQRGASDREAATTLPGSASQKDETQLRRAETSEGREAADVLSRASAQRHVESGLKGAEDESSPERALQRAAKERKQREDRPRVGLPARSGSRRGSGAALPFPREASMKTLISLRNEGKLPVEMKVDFQRNTGGANLLWFEEGTSLSVGARGAADFVITSIPVEGVIGHVVMEKGSLVFYSESRKYFPEVEKPVRNCLRTPILVRSPFTEEETTLRFNQYMHPLERINRIMHLIDNPGKPDFDY